MGTPRLVASDVDGTLLDPMETVTPRTAAVVARVVAAGTPFVLVSGRPPRWIPKVAAAAGVTGLAVCANGSVLYDIADDRIVATHLLSPDVLGDLVHAVRSALPDCRVATERVGGSALAMAGQEFATEAGYRHPWPGDNIYTAPLAEVLGHPAVKLLVRHGGMTSDELSAAVVAVLGDVVEITYSSSVGMVELAPRGVTKGTGLAEVAQRLDVPAADVLAFGDMPNDVPMLRWAGHGVAMANGHPEVLAVADEVTAANGEDGVAQVLERWF
ncbi:MAG TPA: HAD family hydrolase [Pseudonocardiaceae bacterium]|nr:HAD family hydrolase [Pseudonocardiaceae bacterium]